LHPDPLSIPPNAATGLSSPRSPSWRRWRARPSWASCTSRRARSRRLGGEALPAARASPSAESLSG